MVAAGIVAKLPFREKRELETEIQNEL
jgi:hypothetical protein